MSDSPTSAAPSTTSAASPLLVLHVGCGSRGATALHEAFRGPQWRELRLDVDPAARPDVVASMTDMPMVDSASVDAVFSSHNLEHLEAHEVPLALGEFFRVLRPGGLLLVTMPDLEAVARLVAEGKLEEPVYESPAGPVAPIDILYGFRPFIARGARTMAHRTGFTLRSLGRHLRAAGFAEGKLWRQGLDLWAFTSRPAAIRSQDRNQRLSGRPGFAGPPG